MPLHNVDKAKVNAQNLFGVIVKNDIDRMLAWVVVKTGLLKQWYSYHKLTSVVGKGNNIELLGLQEAYLGLNRRHLEMSLWLRGRVREMSLAITRWHVTQIAAVA